MEQKKALVCRVCTVAAAATAVVAAAGFRYVQSIHRRYCGRSITTYQDRSRLSTNSRFRHQNMTPTTDQAPVNE